MKFSFFYIEDTLKFQNTTADDTELLNKLKRELNQRLKKAFIQNISSRDNTTKFKGSFFRFTWNGFDLFNSILNGSIEINTKGDEKTISYRIYFWEMLIYIALFNIIPTVALFPNNFYRILGFAALWLVYIIIIVVTSFRLDSYFTNIIKQNGGVMLR